MSCAADLPQPEIKAVPSPVSQVCGTGFSKTGFGPVGDFVLIYNRRILSASSASSYSEAAESRVLEQEFRPSLNPGVPSAGVPSSRVEAVEEEMCFCGLPSVDKFSGEQSPLATFSKLRPGMAVNKVQAGGL